MEKKIDLSRLSESWPSPYVTRSKISEFSGGMTTPSAMAVIDSRGFGPKERFIINRKTCYPVDCLIEWLESKATMP